ncbi:hypothetical protein K2X33_14455 [bacterium]|nr:hypothetical protein [bacterium]
MKYLLGLVFLSSLAMAAEPATTGGNVRYKKGKDINFEELLIQGQLRRGEISVVTGDAQDGTDGLLRLRENFLDRVAVDAGEEVK